MATHVIIGNGENADIPQAVVNEALKDGLDDKPTVVVGWYGKPEDSLANVYDFLFDQEIDTVLLYENEEPVKAFREAPNFVVQKVPAMATGFVQEFKNNPGAFMVLGQGDFTDTLLMDVYTDTRPPLVTDLGDGLAPITLEGFDEHLDNEPAGKVEVKDEDPTDDATEDEHATGVEDPDPFSFSREELMNMPHRVLKRLCGQVVPEDEMPTTAEKEPFVDAILAAADEVARAINGDPDMAVETAEEILDQVEQTASQHMLDEEDADVALLNALGIVKRMQEVETSRTLAVVITKIEEALLWYHYGDEIHGGS